MSETLLVTIPCNCGRLCSTNGCSGLHRRCGGGGGITLGQQLSDYLVLLFKLL